MAVIAAPPPVPVQAQPATIVRGEPVAGVAVLDHQVQVFGSRVLDAEAVRRALMRGDDLSGAVMALAQAYVDAGYPAARLYYARVGRQVYVLARLENLDAVRAPEPLHPYFADLVGESPLTAAAFERRRALASLHADRAGLNAEPLFLREGDRSVLDLRPDDASPADPARLSAQFGNPGNRLSGRYFGELDLRYAFASGDEFGAAYTHGFPALGGDSSADGLEEQRLEWSRVAPYGIVSLSARNVDFAQRLPATAGGLPPLLSPLLRPLLDSLLAGGADSIRYEGRVQQAQLSMLEPVLAGVHSRTTVELQVDYTRKEFRQDGGESLQSQEYGALQAGMLHSAAWRSARQQGLTLDAALTLRSGLGSDRGEDPLVAADLGFLAVRPELRLDASPWPQWSLSLQASAQLTGDSLPDEEQFVLGGAERIAAYLPGVVVADSGLHARIALRREGAALGPFKLEPGFFAEYAYADTERARVGMAEGWQSLSDAGVELAGGIGRLEAKLVYAWPFAEQNVDAALLDDSRAELVFSLTARF